MDARNCFAPVILFILKNSIGSRVDERRRERVRRNTLTIVTLTVADGSGAGVQLEDESPSTKKFACSVEIA